MRNEKKNLPRKTRKNAKKKMIIFAAIRVFSGQSIFCMKSAEIIAIGSELLTPERSDTNSLWFTERLNEIGVEVKLKTIVGDDEARS